MNALNVDLNGMTQKMNKLITGSWFLKDLDKVEKNGLKVFSCFHCGGGSTMGYKLAGFEMLGGVDIDPKMMNIYRANHSPKHSYLMGVQDFKKIPNDKIPKELFNLDVLDGSPPCSSFSMAGSREKAWGDNKKFREGQAEQVLDDLFFDFIDVAKKLKPRIVVAENVKGLVIGKAKGYVKMINDQFNNAGYDLQLFLLNSAFMGVAQKRERTFFIARRKDLNLPRLNLNFNEPVISIEKSWFGLTEQKSKMLKQETKQFKYWHLSKPGVAFTEAAGSGWFSHKKIVRNEPCWTVTAHAPTELYHDIEPRILSRDEILRIQSFPDDFDFLNETPGYVCGMSVPPLMMQRVANQIAHQFFNKTELKV